MQKKSYFSYLVVFSILILSVASASALTSQQAYNAITGFVEKTSGVNFIVGVVFGIWNFSATQQYLLPGKEMSHLIIYLVVWIITLLVIRDVLYLGASFDEKTTWIISIGLVIVASQMEGVFFLVGILAAITSYFAAIAVWLEIVAIVVIFFLSIFGAEWAGRFAIARRMQREKMNARRSAQEIANTVSTIKTIGKEINK